MTDTAAREPDARAIVDAARTVLATVGYGGFTVEAVAAQAGVDPATVGHWWAGKDELLVDVLGEAMAINEIPDVGDSRNELRTAVYSMIGAYTDRQRFEPALLALAAEHAEHAEQAGHAGQADNAVLKRLRQHLRRGREHVDTALRRAAERGDLPPDVDIDLVQDMWAGTIAYHRLVSGGSFPIDVIDPLLDLVLSGMAPLRAPAWPAVRPVPDGPWSSELLEALEWLNQQAFGQVHPLTDGIPARALAAMPSTATIAGRAVTASAGVWRDFTPPVDEDGTALKVSVTVTAAGTGVLPPFLRADRVAVLHDHEVWVAPLVEETPRSRTSRKFQVTARHGPTWEPGGAVDVVVHLHGEQATRQLLRVPGTLIGRTD